MAAAENCWNHGDSHARSRLPLKPAWSRFSFLPSAVSAWKMSLWQRCAHKNALRALQQSASHSQHGFPNACACHISAAC